MAIQNIVKLGGPGYLPISEGCKYFSDFSFGPGQQAVDLTDYQATTNTVAIGGLDRSSPLGTGITTDGGTSNYGYVLNHQAQHNLDDGSGFTIYAFIKRTATNSGVRQLFNKQFTTTATSPFLDWMLALKNDNFELRIGASFLSTSIATTLDVWHSMVFTGDGTNWRIYLDGILQQTNGISATPSNTNSITPRIGHLNFTGTPAEVFIGVIGQVGIWNRALSQQEVLRLDRHARGELITLNIDDPLGATPADPIVQSAPESVSVTGIQGFVSTNTPGATLTAQTHVITPGNDSVYRSIDPSGLALKPTTDTAPTLDKTNLTNNSTDEFVVNGATFTYTPILTNSPNTYNFYLDCHPDEATIDPKSGVVTLDTSTLPTSASVQPNDSHYFVIGCKNSAGQDEITVRLHIGLTSANIIYVGAGETYTTNQAALAAARADSSIKRVVIRNGTYTGVENTIAYLDARVGGLTGIYPPAGTALDPFIIMAETPMDVTLDGQGLDRVLQFAGDTKSPAGDRGVNDYNQDHIRVYGINTENMKKGGASFSQSLYNIFRFCSFGSVVEFEPNTICGGIFSSQQGLLEYCYGYGWSRYVLSVFEGIECATRRSMVRLGGYSSSAAQGYTANQPGPSGHSHYAVKRSEMQNCGVLDSESINTFPSITTSSTITLAIQNTVGGSGLNFNEDCKITSCWTVNVFNGGIDLFVPNQITGKDTVVDSFVSYGTTLPDYDGLGAVAGLAPYSTVLSGRGLHTFNDISYLNCDLSDTGPLAAALFRCETDPRITNFFFDPSNTTTTLALAVAWGGTQNATIDNYSINGWSNLDVPLGTTATFTNRNDFEATEANGFKYIPRIESGSPLGNASIGCQSLEYCVGKLGAFYEDAGWSQTTTIPVFPYRGSTRAMNRWRDRTTTQETFTSGAGSTEVVSGNFGVATVDNDPNYYVWAEAGNVPFPFYVNARAEGTTSAYIAWDVPSKLYFDTYVKYFIWIKNITDGDAEFSRNAAVNRFDNSYTLTGLTAGKTYDFAVTAVDTNSRESALSYATRVTL